MLIRRKQSLSDLRLKKMMPISQTLQVSKKEILLEFTKENLQLIMKILNENVS